ncbi:p150-Glued [Schizosaccharomyces osmophilus]|uniref:P150-Glued n=1 Tax=Schizosaccharomyces osmophilus TaxID=2545709 RepID=A0AAE9WGP7_9SCHI|nr:p150-Glued [Schizosaccharomyces osmophilus]WBW74393.1 p150-Glued [Schizosaccharomyces osmophilus]
MSYVSVGDLVLVHGEPGIVRFTGSTNFASGIWLGVEMIDKIGRHDGSVQGKRYFTCEEGKGIFIRACSSSVRKQTAKCRGISDAKKAKPLEKQTPTKPSYKAKENQLKKVRSQGKDEKNKSVWPSLSVSTPTKTEDSNVSTPFLELIEDSETTLISIGSDSLENTPINEIFENDKRASIDFTNSHTSAPHLLSEKNTIIESNTKFQLKLEIETLRKELNEADNSLNYYKASYNKANEQLNERCMKLEELNREKETNSAWRNIRPKLQKKMLSMQEEIERLKQQLKSCNAQGHGIGTPCKECENFNANELVIKNLTTEKSANVLATYERAGKNHGDEDYICYIEEIRKENLELKTQIEDLQLLKELSDEIERDQFDKIVSLEKENQQKGDLLTFLENAFSFNVETTQTETLQKEQAKHQSCDSKVSEIGTTTELTLRSLHNLIQATQECYELKFKTLEKMYLDEESSNALKVSFMLFYIQNVSLSLNESIYNKIDCAKSDSRQLLLDFIEPWYYTISIAQWSKWLVGFTCKNGVEALSSDALLKNTIVNVFCLLDVYVKYPGESKLENLQNSWSKIENWVKERVIAGEFDPYNEYRLCKELLNSVFLINLVITNTDQSQNHDVIRVPSEMTEIGAITEDIHLFLRQKSKIGKVFFPNEKVISMDHSLLAGELFFKSRSQKPHTQITYLRIVDDWKKSFQKIKGSLQEFQSYISENDDTVFLDTDPYYFWDVVLKALPSPSENTKGNSSLKLVLSEKNELINHLKVQVERLNKQVMQKEVLKEKINSYELLEKDLREELFKAKAGQKSFCDADHLKKIELEKKQLEEMFKQNELTIRMKFQEIINKFKQDLNKARKEVLNANQNQNEDYGWLFKSLKHEDHVAKDDYIRIPQQLHTLASKIKPVSVDGYFHPKQNKNRND